MTVACTQEAPLFSELHSELKAAGKIKFVNIRETAGWSADAAVPVAVGASLVAGLLAGLVVVRQPPLFLAVSTWILSWLVLLVAFEFPEVAGGSQGYVLTSSLSATGHYELALLLTAAGIAGAEQRARNDHRSEVLAGTDLTLAAQTEPTAAGSAAVGPDGLVRVRLRGSGRSLHRHHFGQHSSDHLGDGVLEAVGGLGLAAVRGQARPALGIVQVQPEKERARRLLQPIQSAVNTLSGFTIHQTQVPFAELFRRERVVVKVEATRQSPTAIEHECAHHRAGSITLLLESLCYRAETRFQWLAGEILHAVLEGIRSCEDDGMRWPSLRDLRDGTLESRAVLSQGIQSWRLHTGGAIAAEGIGANRVDGDEYDIGQRAKLNCRFGRGRSVARKRRCQRQQSRDLS